MKNISYISGILGILTISAGVIFKLNHWPGASIFLALGIMFYILFFFPVTFLGLIKRTSDKLLKILYAFALITLMLSFTGMLFKLNHWPGSNFLMITGILFPFILFLPVFIYYHTKRKLDTTLGFFSIILFMIYLGVFSSLLAIRESGAILYTHFQNAEVIQSGNKLLMNSININAESQKLIETIDELKVQMVLHADERNKEFISNGKLTESTYIYNSEKRVGNNLLEREKFRFFLEAYKQFESHNKNKFSKPLFDEINKELSITEFDVPNFVTYSMVDLLSLFNNWQNKILLISYMNS